MPREYARFASIPIGPSLAATDGGLTLTTLSAGLNVQRTARANVPHSSGSRGVEFVFWGDDPLIAAIGLVQASASLSMFAGGDSGSVGWRFDTGRVSLDGVQQVLGLTAPSKGQVVGVHFREVPGASQYVDFYRDTTLVHSQLLPYGASWYFAVSMGSTLAGGLVCAVNAGQWPVLTNAGQAGWRPGAAGVTTVRLADRHWLTAATDTPPHARYEGLIAASGIDSLSAIGFWPWQDAVSPRGGSAQFTAYDAHTLLDPLDGASDVHVRVLHADPNGTHAASESLGRYILDSIQCVDDGSSLVRLRDPHDMLDEPINRGVFLPYITALAWQPQPLVIGAVASVPLLAANSDGTVGFLCDAPLAHVSTVLDRGDALETGTWSIAPGNQQLLLESPPLGPVVADVSSIGSPMSPATLAQTLHHVFSRVGCSAWSSTDAATIDSTTGYAGIGFYVGGGVRSAREARDAILSTYGAACYQAADGVLRFTRLIDPDSVSETAVLSQADLGEDLTWVTDTAPNLTRRMAYRPNAARMSASDFVTDLVDVPMSRRAELMQPYRGIAYSAVPLAARYAAAERREPFVSMFWAEDDAQREIDRICGLYSVDRRFYSWRSLGAFTPLLVPGQIVRVTYPRYGLAGGRNLMVASVQRNSSTGRQSIRLWGA